MAGSGVAAGHETRANIYWEDNGFAQSPNDSEPKTPGADVQVGTAEGSNAVQRVFMPGQRTAIDLIAMVFEGSFSLEFSVTNPWWIKTILGDPSTTDNGDGTHTHDFTGTSPTSFQIVEGLEQGSSERLLKGCVVTQGSVEISTEQEARVSLRGAYADEETDVPDSLTAQTTPDHKPMTYADASISVGGETEGYVQSITLDFAANVDLIREMGSRVAVDFNPKQFEPDVQFGKIYDGDTSNIEEMYGGETSVQEDVENTVAVEVTLDNGSGAGSGMNQIVWTLSGTLTDSYGQSGIGDPRADLEETVSRVGLNMDASATNETATAL